MQKGQKSIIDNHKSLYADLNVVHDVASLTKKVHPQIRTSPVCHRKAGEFGSAGGSHTEVETECRQSHRCHA